MSSGRKVHLEIRQSMSTLMDMMNVTKVTMAWELHQQGVPKTHIAQRLGKHRETIHLWIKGVEQEGLMPFLDRYLKAKKGRRPRRCQRQLGIVHFRQVRIDPLSLLICFHSLFRCYAK